MGKTWILHTETKGTGAQMVPLESVTKPSSPVEPVFVRKPRPKPEPPAPAPRAPHRFKIVDVMTRQPLAEDVSTRQAVELLADVRSIVDVNVYVWQEEQQQWWLMTFGQMRALWDLAHRPPEPAGLN